MLHLQLQKVCHSNKDMQDHDARLLCGMSVNWAKKPFFTKILVVPATWFICKLSLPLCIFKACVHRSCICCCVHVVRRSADPEQLTCQAGRPAMAWSSMASHGILPALAANNILAFTWDTWPACWKLFLLFAKSSLCCVAQQPVTKASQRQKAVSAS